MLVNPFSGEGWDLPPAGPELREALILGIEHEPPPVRDGDELFLSLYLPLVAPEGDLTGYLLLEAGAHLSTQLMRLRQGLWIATGAGVVFVAFVLLSMAGILAQARRRQREMDRAAHLAHVGTLAAGLAHEIRNPLAIILGNSELMEMEAAEREAADEHHGWLIDSIASLSFRHDGVRVPAISLTGLCHRAFGNGCDSRNVEMVCSAREISSRAVSMRSMWSFQSDSVA